MEKKILFTKVRDVKSPVRAFPTSAGIDFFMPTINKELIEGMSSVNPVSEGIMYQTDYAYIALPPGRKILIPSGIKAKFEDGSALVAANKSGKATKDGLLFTAQVVDSEYTGEIHIGLYNSGLNEVRISSGDKLIQFLQVPVMLNSLEYISPEYYSEITSGSLRGEAGFGSTDNK